MENTLASLAPFTDIRRDDAEISKSLERSASAKKYTSSPLPRAARQKSVDVETLQSTLDRDLTLFTVKVCPSLVDTMLRLTLVLTIVLLVADGLAETTEETESGVGVSRGR